MCLGHEYGEGGIEAAAFEPIRHETENTNERAPIKLVNDIVISTNLTATLSRILVRFSSLLNNVASALTPAPRRSS